MAIITNIKHAAKIVNQSLAMFQERKDLSLKFTLHKGEAQDSPQLRTNDKLRKKGSLLIQLNIHLQKYK